MAREGLNRREHEKAQHGGAVTCVPFLKRVEDELTPANPMLSMGKSKHSLHVGC